MKLASAGFRPPPRMPAEKADLPPATAAELRRSEDFNRKKSKFNSKNLFRPPPAFRRIARRANLSKCRRNRLLYVSDLRAPAAPWDCKKRPNPQSWSPYTRESIGRGLPVRIYSARIDRERENLLSVPWIRLFLGIRRSRRSPEVGDVQDFLRRHAFFLPPGHE